MAPSASEHEFAESEGPLPGWYLSDQKPHSAKNESSFCIAGNAGELASNNDAIIGQWAISWRHTDEAGLLPIIQPISWYWLPMMTYICDCRVRFGSATSII